MAWTWPDGGAASVNGKYWKHGSPVAGYSIGCYTASKLVMIQGVLDYYHRVKNDAKTLSDLESRLQQGAPH